MKINKLQEYPKIRLASIVGRTLLSREKTERLLNRISNPLNITINKYGDKYPEKWFYFINIDEEYKYNGFCSLYKTILYMLSFADYLKLSPIVKIGKGTMYYDDSILGDNVFEYYFEPIRDISVDEIKHCEKVTSSKTDDVKVFGKLGSYDIPEENEIEFISKINHKYIHLNNRTIEIIQNNLNAITADGKTLGVHVRATDYNQGYNKHPVVVKPEEYLEKAKQVFNDKQFSQVFLATDEERVIELFKDYFHEKLFYYSDTYRSKNGEAIHYGRNSESNREHHKYLLGLEILMDVYTLGHCAGLIAGNSNVSYIARVIRLSECGKYDYCEIIDKGINHNLKRVRSHFNNMLRN